MAKPNRIKIDEKALAKLVEPARKGYETDVNRIAQSMRGRPVSEVERELKKAAKQNRIEPGKNTRDLARRISES